MEFSKKDLSELDRVQRIKYINAVSGIKPANLIGTISKGGQTNVAIISSVVHLGSNPPLIGYICRPNDTVPRHTLENILDTKQYTINHIHSSMIENAHYTSAKFERHISEFDRCGLNPIYKKGFIAPFVKESYIKMGMQLVETVPIKHNGTLMVIGEIVYLQLPDHIIEEGYEINLEKAKGVGISGLNSYYTLNKVAEYPYARTHEVPHFKKQS